MSRIIFARVIIWSAFFFLWLIFAQHVAEVIGQVEQAWIETLLP